MSNLNGKPFLFPEWAQKVLGWILLTVLTLYTTTEVSKARIDALQQQQNRHEEAQVQKEENAITRPEFNQFKEDLVNRLDRMENKLDRIQQGEKREQHR